MKLVDSSPRVVGRNERRGEERNGKERGREKMSKKDGQCLLCVFVLGYALFLSCTYSFSEVLMSMYR